MRIQVTATKEIKEDYNDLSISIKRQQEKYIRLERHMGAMKSEYEKEIYSLQQVIQNQKRQELPSSKLSADTFSPALLCEEDVKKRIEDIEEQKDREIEKYKSDQIRLLQENQRLRKILRLEEIKGVQLINRSSNSSEKNIFGMDGDETLELQKGDKFVEKERWQKRWQILEEEEKKNQDVWLWLDQYHSLMTNIEDNLPCGDNEMDAKSLNDREKLSNQLRKRLSLVETSVKLQSKELRRTKEKCLVEIYELNEKLESKEKEIADLNDRLTLKDVEQQVQQVDEIGVMSSGRESIQNCDAETDSTIFSDNENPNQELSETSEELLQSTNEGIALKNMLQERSLEDEDSYSQTEGIESWISSTSMNNAKITDNMKTSSQISHVNFAEKEEERLGVDVEREHTDFKFVESIDKEDEAIDEFNMTNRLAKMMKILDTPKMNSWMTETTFQEFPLERRKKIEKVVGESCRDDQCSKDTSKFLNKEFESHLFPEEKESSPAVRENKTAHSITLFSKKDNEEFAKEKDQDNFIKSDTCLDTSEQIVMKEKSKNDTITTSKSENKIVKMGSHGRKIKHRPKNSSVEKYKWVAYWDNATSLYYYHNRQTKETTWIPPTTSTEGSNEAQKNVDIYYYPHGSTT